MAIALGSDHGGFELKNEIKKHLEDLGLAVQDFGTHTKDSVDYPDIAEAVCVPVAAGAFDFGILVCGTGIGISIAANKVDGIRAAHCTDAYSAAKAKEHNNANVLALGGCVIGPHMAFNIVDTFLNTEFSTEEKHHRRVGQIEAL